MKSSPTIIISFFILTVVVLAQLGPKLDVYPPDSNIKTASFINYFSEIDSFDFNEEEFESEMEQLRTELEVLRNHKFKFEFDSEEFKEEMKQLATELKNLKIDFKDLNVEMEKLNGFLKDLKIEMKKDNLIDDENEEINLELNENEMKINGEQVPDDLFIKYKKLYKKHFGKEPGEDTHIHIN